MTRFLLLPLIGLACSAVPAPETTTSVPDPVPVAKLKSIAGQVIVTYNVENLFDTVNDPNTNDEDFLPEGKLHWTSKRYQRKLSQLAKAISWAGKELPVVVGLTEVENGTVVNDLAHTAPLDKGNYVIAHFESPDERGIDVALLIRADYATVLKKEAMNVPLGDDRTRDVLHVDLELAKGEKLHVFEDHWPSRREGAEKSEPKRMAAAKVVRDKVDEILRADANAKILIMGDFNDYPNDRSIQEGLRASCDPMAKADLFDLMCIDQPADGGSFQYDGKWDYLDQVIVSRGFRSGSGVQATTAAALHDERLLFNHPKYGPSPNKTYSRDDYKGGFSDHLPVVLQVK